VSAPLDADVAVVGLGGIGSATAYYAARAGARVIGLERHALGGHANGASHDHSRIIRRSYHTEEYVRLTAAAYDGWREIEAASGEQCVWTTGGLDLFPPGASIDRITYETAMRSAGVAFDVLDGADVRRRWPAFALDDDVVALYQADAGIVSPEQSVPLLQRLAAAHGAELHGRCTVNELRAEESGVDVVVEGAERPLRVGAVVCATDAWTNDLLAGLGAALPLTVLQEQVSYYDVADPRPFEIGRLPLWIWMDDPGYYGFPVFGRPGVKLAQDCGGQEVGAEGRSFVPDPEILARTDDLAARLFAPRLGPARDTATCLYTLTPDRDFVVDRVPGEPRVVVGLGSAHGYKLVPWFGRTLAELAITGTATTGLASFAFDRPALVAPTGTTAWMV
jgi:sarcosine oxidase